MKRYMTRINKYLFLIVLITAVPGQPLPARVSKHVLFTHEETMKILQGRIITDVFLKHGKRLSTEENRGAVVRIPVTTHTPEKLNNFDMITVEKLFLPYDLDKRPASDLYRTLLSCNKLAGMKYYSHRAGGVKPFILKSAPVSGDITETRVPFKTLPYTRGIFRIKDNKFGEILFKSELFCRGNDFILVNTCTGPVSKFMIELVDKGDYRMISFFIYDRAARGYLCYFLHTLKVKNDLFLRTGIIESKSFGNRIRACTLHLCSLLGIDRAHRIDAFR